MIVAKHVLDISQNYVRPKIGLKYRKKKIYRKRHIGSGYEGRHVSTEAGQGGSQVLLLEAFPFLKGVRSVLIKLLCFGF